ncbi:MAG: HEPN domain-containing protein [Dehalococcoidia bacterium]
MPSRAAAQYQENQASIGALITIHGIINDNLDEDLKPKAGRPYRATAVLHPSAIMMLCAAWEAYVEDVLTEAYDFLVSKSTDPKALPLQVQKHLVKMVDDHQHQLKALELANDGWKKLLLDYRDELLSTTTGSWNTPKTAKVVELTEKLIGLEDISKAWHWGGMSAANARSKLDELVIARGDFAHRGPNARNITKKTVQDFVKHVTSVVTRTDAHIREFLIEQTGAEPWAK